MKAKFVNESIKHLKPKSEEEIRSCLKNLSPEEKLETGAEEGLLWLVKDALSEGADVHARNDYALRWASENGHLEVVKVLLNAGADVHARNDYALRYASENGHLEVVKVLLDAGANVHANNDRALEWASWNGHLEVVKVLLDAGADVHACDDLALRWASAKGHVEVVKLLKQHGARKKKVNESIKHLKPKTEKELRQSIKNLSTREKLSLAIEHKLDWLQKEAVQEFYPELKRQTPIFIELYEYLREKIGKKFEFEMHYYGKTTYGSKGGDFYTLEMIFSCDNLHFIINQHSIYSIYPNIKIAKKISKEGEESMYLFKESTLLKTIEDLNKYLEEKIKESKEITESIKHLTPKSEEEIRQSMTLEDWQFVLYEAGMKFFDSSESDFVDFIYETLGENNILKLFIGKKITYPEVRTSNKRTNWKFGILKFKTNTIEDVKDFINYWDYPIILENILSVLSKHEVKMLLDMLDPEHAKFMTESIKHLKPKSEEEIRSYLKNLSPEEKLETGVKQGISWLVKDALTEGADVHTGDDWALRWASNNGHVEVVKVLLDAGADVHAWDDRALRWASENGHLEVVKLLKQHRTRKKVNESIKHLKPKTLEEIRQALQNMSIRDIINDINQLEDDIEDIDQIMEYDSPGEYIAKLLKRPGIANLSKYEIYRDDNIIDKLKIALKKRNRETYKKINTLKNILYTKYPLLKKIENREFYYSDDSVLNIQDIEKYDNTWCIVTDTQYNHGCNLSKEELSQLKKFIKEKKSNR